MSKKTADKFHKALIACALASVLPANAEDISVPDYSGAWRIVTYGTWQAHPLCFFDQAGRRLTGSCMGLTNEGAVEGTVDRDGLRIKWAGEPFRNCGDRLCSCHCTFSGKRVAENHIVGTAERNGVKERFEAFKQY